MRYRTRRIERCVALRGCARCSSFARARRAGRKQETHRRGRRHRHPQEQEAYIRQMEQDQQVPGTMQIVKPEAGFAVKTHRLDAVGGKVFINVCHSSLVEKPRSQPAEDGKSGSNWSLPHLLSAPHMEKDAKGALVGTVRALRRRLFGL